MRDTELLVIGDSHTNFWNGTGHPDGDDSIQGVRSQTIPGALAYSLIKEHSQTDARALTLGTVYAAVAEGFQGWIMLNFGANDCNGWIWRQLPRISFEESVRAVVERYVQFINEVRAIYPKIAVFAPPATTKSPLFLGDVGTEPERNLAILVFTSMLEQRVGPLRIPVISMARAMLTPAGKSRGDLFWDCNHSSQAMMPYALKLVNETLGLNLRRHDDPVRPQEYRVRTFASVDTCDLFEKNWLRFVLPEGAQYISDIAVWPDTFAELGQIEVVTSLDRHTYKIQSYDFHDDANTCRLPRYLPVGQHARNILLSSPVRAIDQTDVEIYKYASPISELLNYSSDALFALHDRVMQQTPIPVISGETHVAATFARR